MSIHSQSSPQPTAIPGVDHATWAGQAEGLTQLSVWRQTLAPGASTPPHAHPCDEVVLCLSGHGEVHIEGRVERFGADQTLVLPKNIVHRIFNVGPLPLETLAAIGQSPVEVVLPDGALLDLPWRS